MKKISIQGYQGSFHHIASELLWGKDVELLERATFKEVFEDLLSQKVDYSICAVENTIAGSVSETLDLLLSKDVYVIGEVVLHIHQNLIVIPGTKIEELKRVYSHPVALQQCLGFFEKYPQIELISTDDTGKSVERMMNKKDSTVGSVASTLAAKLFNAEILVPKIQMDQENYTRFFVLSREPEVLQQIPEEGVKTSIALKLPHTVGALAKILTILAEQNFNLTKIESRPILGHPWEYAIFIDMLSVHNEKDRQKALKLIEPHTAMLKILGSYLPGKVFET
jgi:prephenate dehydratase